MKRLMILGFILFLSAQQSLGQLEGKEGGGGDESERQFGKIVQDLSSWIVRGGSQNLALPEGVSLEYYNNSMLDRLAPHATIISFTTKQSEVMVNGEPKTCRGYVVDLRDQSKEYHIRCHIGRFNQTSEPGQYRLIHHEFAGLELIEANRGASSDYQVSNQLSLFLDFKFVSYLAIRPRPDSEELMAACGDETSNNGSFLRCVSIVRSGFVSTQHISACGDETSNNDSFLRCVSIVRSEFVSTQHIGACGDVTSNNDSLLRCVSIVRSELVSTRKIKSCGRQTGTNGSFLQCLNL